MNDNDQLRFPVGKFVAPDTIRPSDIEFWISEITHFYDQLKTITKGLSVAQLNWQYRPQGWTIKQVVHHCADSHMNSFIRFKLALTEENPTIRPYYEDRWAELSDGLDNDIDDSLLLLAALHRKWSKLLKQLTPVQLEKTFVHPESGETFTLKENIGIYAWHCRHHLAHIKQAIAYQGTF